jgi:hypothetical protein
MPRDGPSLVPVGFNADKLDFCQPGVLSCQQRHLFARWTAENGRLPVVVWFGMAA